MSFISVLFNDFLICQTYVFVVVGDCSNEHGAGMALTGNTKVRGDKPPPLVDCILNVMAHAQKPDFVFRRKGRVHLNRWGSQFSLLLAAEVRASAVVTLDKTCSEVV